MATRKVKKTEYVCIRSFKLKEGEGPARTVGVGEKVNLTPEESRLCRGKIALPDSVEAKAVLKKPAPAKK